MKKFIALIAILSISSCATKQIIELNKVRQVSLNCFSGGAGPWLSVNGTPDSFIHHGDHITVRDASLRSVMDVSGQCSLRYWHADELEALKREQEKAAAQAKAEPEAKVSKKRGKK